MGKKCHFTRDQRHCSHSRDVAAVLGLRRSNGVDYAVKLRLNEGKTELVGFCMYAFKISREERILVFWKVKSAYRGIFPKLPFPADGLRPFTGLWEMPFWSCWAETRWGAGLGSGAGERGWAAGLGRACGGQGALEPSPPRVTAQQAGAPASPRLPADNVFRRSAVTRVPKGGWSRLTTCIWCLLGQCSLGHPALTDTLSQTVRKTALFGNLGFKTPTCFTGLNFNSAAPAVNFCTVLSNFAFGEA